MPVYDPGSGTSIQWAKTPSYTVTLLTELQRLPRPRAHNLFRLPSKLSPQARLQRSLDLAAVTAALFVASSPSDASRHEGSVNRRLSQARLTTDTIRVLPLYVDGIHRLNKETTATGRADKLQYINATNPFWPDLHALLLDYAEAPVLRDLQAVTDDADEDDRDAFQGNAIAGPANLQPYIPPVNPGHAAPAAAQPPALQPPAHPSSDDYGDVDWMQDVVFHGAPDAVNPAAPLGAAPVGVHPEAAPNVPPPALAAPNLQYDDDGGGGADVDDEGELPTHCYVCEQPLPMDAESNAAHLRACFESAPGGGSHVAACVVCQEVFPDSWSLDRKEQHVVLCLEGGGKRSISERDEFMFDVSSMPREADGSVKECSICFDEFEVAQKGTRLLRCGCVYHSPCIDEFWRGEQARPTEKQRMCIVEH